VLKVVKAAGQTSAAPVAQEQSSGGNNIVGWASLAVAIVALLLAAFAVTRSRRMPE
jgi:hypothetical protein